MKYVIAAWGSDLAPFPTPASLSDPEQVVTLMVLVFPDVVSQSRGFQCAHKHVPLKTEFLIKEQREQKQDWAEAGFWGSSHAGRQLAASCFHLVMFSLSSPHVSLVPSKAQLLFRDIFLSTYTSFQGELFLVTVLLSLTIPFLQKHVHGLKSALFFSFKWDILFIFSPVFFPPLRAAASPAGAALVVAREMGFFHFYCNFIDFFSPLMGSQPFASTK